LRVSEAGGYVSDFLSGDGLARATPLTVRAPGIKEALTSGVHMEGVTL
jgi:hypothetical protein